jgi:hypothetical protein
MALLSLPNVKPGLPPVAAPERSDGAATGGRAEALVGACNERGSVFPAPVPVSWFELKPSPQGSA